MTRRQVVTAALTLVLIAFLFVLVWPIPPLRRALIALLRPRVDTRAPTGALSAAELDTLLAYAEVLAAPARWSEEDRQALAHHVEERAGRRPGFLALYRTTARVLEERADRRFTVMGRAERTRLIVRERLVPASLRPLDYLTTLDRRRLSVSGLAAPDLLQGYYDSASGWAIVGYTSFPGRCGDLMRYTRPEG